MFNLHTVNDMTKIASSIGYSFHSKKFDATLGFVHNCPHGHQWKGKVGSDGVAALSFKHTIASGLSLTLSSAIDLGSKSFVHSNPHPIGFGVDYKF